MYLADIVERIYEEEKKKVVFIGYSKGTEIMREEERK